MCGGEKLHEAESLLLFYRPNEGKFPTSVCLLTFRAEDLASGVNIIRGCFVGRL